SSTGERLQAALAGYLRGFAATAAPHINVERPLHLPPQTASGRLQPLSVTAQRKQFSQLSPDPVIECNNLFLTHWNQGTMVRGQGNILIKRDAGQVIAGNAVTNIDKYIAGPQSGAWSLAFFLAL
ncbi:MAG: hypothetical protein KKH55_06310, partial [Gammaproteobacteria bacterium]|nr:hypothetical protein [Gammaproteobacteria bacterium]